MDHYSIFAPSGSAGAEAMPPKAELASASAGTDRLRFPAEDGGQSLSQMAQRDLSATLQLLTERAQYITGASGAAIALRDAGEMICRASAGGSAPELGAHLQVDSGLSGESVRTKQILRCDDAESDSRVNRESCRALGISSVMVMPLVRDEEVIGVFELFSGRTAAFEERDIVALQRIADMILTAVAQAEAAKKTEVRITSKEEEVAVEVEAQKPVEAVTEEAKPEPEPVEPSVKPHPVQGSADPPQNSTAATATPERLNVRKCEKCGFPVSEGRTLCLDCESAQPADGSTQGVAYSASLALGEMQEESWLRSHWYVMVIMVIAAIVIGVLLRMR